MYTLSQTMPLSHPKPMRFPDQYRNAYLQDQDRRHSHHKIPVLCLMMKQIHASPRSDTAAQNTHKEKCFLRYPPCMMSRLAFVHCHHCKSNEIHNDQIDQKSFLHSPVSLRFFCKCEMQKRPPEGSRFPISQLFCCFIFS